MLTVILELSVLRPDWTSCDLLPFVTRDFSRETIHQKTECNFAANFPYCSFLCVIFLVFTEDLINFKEIFTFRFGLNICLFWILR